MTPLDEPTIARILREAPWDLPLTDQLLTGARRELEARQAHRRSRLPRGVAVLAAAAALALVVVAASVAVRVTLGRGGTALPSLPSPAASSQRAAPTGEVIVGGWGFHPPAGLLLDPEVSTSNAARFGPSGLVHDGRPLGPDDLRLLLTGRSMHTPDQAGHLWITELTPVPTADHPGPHPTGTPTGAERATPGQRAMVAVETGLPWRSVSDVPSLPIGPGWLLTTDDRNAVLLVAPQGSPVVLMIESAGLPARVLVEVARSLRPGAPVRIDGGQPTAASQSPA